MAASASCPRASRFISPATPRPSPRRPRQRLPRLFAFLAFSKEPLPLSRFPAAARLRHTSEFLAVRADGRMVQGRWLRLSVLRRTGEDAATPARMGVVTSRRVGGAVQRNRVRRRVREIFRARRGQFPAGLWLVVVAKPGAAEASFASLREEWLRLAGRLSILRDP